MQSSDDFKLKINHNLQQAQRTYSMRETINIYTVWANHYLEKVKHRRPILDIQVDVTDGVVLAEVIEAATTRRVPGICREPTTTTEMVDNIQACLILLSRIGVVVEGISAVEIQDGNLKTILNLFYQLSRYIQYQKQKNRDAHNSQQLKQEQSNLHYHQQPVALPGNIQLKHNPRRTLAIGETGVNSGNNKHTTYDTPTSHSMKTGNTPTHHRGQPSSGWEVSNFLQQDSQGSNIPPLDKVSGVCGRHSSNGSLNCVKPTSASSSRSSSPSSAAHATGSNSQGDGVPHSLIPQPRCAFSMVSTPSIRSSIGEKHSLKYPTPEHVPTTSITTGPISKQPQTTYQNKSTIYLPHAGSNQQAIFSGSNNKGMMVPIGKFKKMKETEKPNKMLGSTVTANISRNSMRGTSGFNSLNPTRSASGVVDTPSTICTGVILRNHQEGQVDRLDKSVLNQMNDFDTSSTSAVTKRRCQNTIKAQQAPESIYAVQRHSGDTSSPKNPTTVKNDSSGSVVKEVNQDISDFPLLSRENPTSEDYSRNSSKVASFIRQNKSQYGRVTSANIKNRISCTGIPTPCSFMGTKDQTNLSAVPTETVTSHENINQGANLNINTNSITRLKSTSYCSNIDIANNPAMSMTNELTRNLGIPKPTAAVKGNTKQPSSNKQHSPSLYNENEIKQMNNYDNVIGRRSKIKTDMKCGDLFKAEVTSSSKKDLREKSSSENSCSVNSNGVSIDLSNSVALVSPMPNPANVVSNTDASIISAIEKSQSTNAQSQLPATSISHSNSAGVTIMLTRKYQLQQLSTGADNIPTPLEESDDDIFGNSTKLNNDVPRTQDSPGFDSSTASGWSSIGSLSKISGEFDSSPPAISMSSTAPEDNTNENKKQQGDESKLKCKGSNGRTFISDSTDDDLLLTVKPMEPFVRNSLLGYPKNSLESTTGLTNSNCVQMRRADSYRNRNPDCHSDKVKTRKAAPYIPSYDYADIDNFDLNLTGYLSDVDQPIHDGATNTFSNLRHSDGSVSESGIPIYGPTKSFGVNSMPFYLNEIGAQINSASKYGFITEDRQGDHINSLRISKSSPSVSKAASPQTIVFTDQQSHVPTTDKVIVSVEGDCTTRDKNIKQSRDNVVNGDSHGGGRQCGDSKNLINNPELKSDSGRGQQEMMGVKECHHQGDENGGSASSSGSSSRSAVFSESGKGNDGEIARMRSSSHRGTCIRGNGIGFLNGPGNKYGVPVTRRNSDVFKQTHETLFVSSVGSTQINPTITGPQCNQSERSHSPKIRTKMKVSGGTQTTSDLKEISLTGREKVARYSQQIPISHHGHHRHSQTLPGQPRYRQRPGDRNHYAASSCSRPDPFVKSPTSPSMGTSSYKSMSLTAPTAANLSRSLKERILCSQSLPNGANSSVGYGAIIAAVQCRHQQQQLHGPLSGSRDRFPPSYATGVALSGGVILSPNVAGSDCGDKAYNEDNAASGAECGFGNSGSTWLRHNTVYASNVSSSPRRLIGAPGGSMTETESLESLSSTSSLAMQLREHSLAKSRIQSAGGNRGMDQGATSRSSRLNRSDSISHFRERTFPRSTKSEKLYPSMMQRGEEGDPYYSSTMSASGVVVLPTSPIHGPTARICSGPAAIGTEGQYSSVDASSSQSVRLSMSPYSMSGFLAKTSTKEGETNASSLSLVSTASSLYSAQEDQPSREVRKLKKELAEARHNVRTLTNQVTTNAHVVAAFEQSLSNMTQRLQTLTLTTEQKDSELTELRKTIHLLRKQTTTVGEMAEVSDGSPLERQLSADSVSSINSISSACSGASHSYASSPSGQVQVIPLGTAAVYSPNLNTPDSPCSMKKNSKGKGWLRSSFTKAFSRSKSKYRNESNLEHGDMKIPQHESHFRHVRGNEVDGSLLASQQFGNPLLTGEPSHGTYRDRPHTHRTIPRPFPQQQASPQRFPNSTYSKIQGQSGGSSKPAGARLPTTPLLSHPIGEERKSASAWSVSTGTHSPRSNGGNSAASLDGRSIQGASSRLAEVSLEEQRSVEELRKQLREKEMALTDIRLEALTSAHQLEALKKTVTKMRNEILSLKQDNERLQRMVSCKSLNSSQSSLQLSGDTDRVDFGTSSSEVPPPSSMALDMCLTDDMTEKEGKCIIVSVYLGCHGSYERYIKPVEGPPAQESAIGTIIVSSRTKWDILDMLVKRTFKDYLMCIDPKSSLGLNSESVAGYAVGEVLRTEADTPPELLPCGYLVGDVTKIHICLRGAVVHELDALAFETLVPKSVLQRAMNLISDHGRIIFCGAAGTGKSYLARKLGEYLVARSGKDPCQEAIASFSADHKNSNELRQYLSNFMEQCDATAGLDLPHVIILDNLHQVDNLGDVFNGVFLKQKEESPKSKKISRPIIIGTMTMTQSTNIQSPTVVHHSFRLMVFTSHAEPVKGLLSRFLHRRLIEVDTQNGMKNLDLAKIVDWVPKAWHHVNKFIETHNSGDVTIGPRLFLSCPMDVENSQAWFADLWHYFVAPYLIEAVKEGLKLYGKRSPWEDPAEYLCVTYPWCSQHAVQFKKPINFLRIRAEEVGYDDAMTKSGDAVGVGIGENANVDNKEQGNGDTDSLTNMLLRLQEAANYSGSHKSNRHRFD